MTQSDRQRGCLIGLAIGDALGDALGAAVGFKPPGTFEPVTGYRAGGPHRIEPGEWTDDTSMALALADSIATAGWDLNDQARQYVAWSTRGEYSVATTSGPDKLGLRQALELFANEQWTPDHIDDDQRAAWIMDQFRRTVAGELKLLGLELR